MGTNKRYAESAQRRRLNREAEEHALVPRSLSVEERGTDVHGGPPVPVRAWVSYGDKAVQVNASVVEYTAVAVRIMWPGLGEEIRDCWIWASACERIEP